MSSCCSTSSESKNNKRHTCPANGKEYLQVSLSTVLQHVKKPWQIDHNKLIEQSYYFCSDPDCDVVYFAENDVMLNKSELRTLVGIKEPNNDEALSCYCFDVTHAEARKDPEIKQYVINKTKNKQCACESQNPSGKCCLKDFP